MDTKNSTATNEELFDEQQYLWDVLDSDLDPIEKIKKIADNHQLSSSDIIAELLQLAPYPENYFEQSKPVCANGEPFCDYIASNRLRFDTLNRYIKELKKEGEYEALYKANKKFFIDVDTAIALFMLYDYIDTLDSTEDVNSPKIIKEFYVTSLKIIDICTDYLEAARIKYGNDLVYYNVGQRSLMKKRFLKEEEGDEPQSAPTEAPKVNEPAKAESKRATVVEEAASAVQQKNETKLPKKKKKFPFFAFYLIACSSISALLTLLAIITKDSLFNIILLVKGLLDIGTAYVLYKILLHKERFTCPQCGTKREHHRHFKSTTTNIISKPSKPGGGYVGFRTIEYTHHYTDTYTCPKCGEEQVEQVEKRGGYFKEYEDGRVEDRRSAPHEF